MADQPARKPRVDAERNRERLLATAKATFAKRGTDASLEEIARETGVGIGTLYRHFPTRDALVSAVYRSETDQLASAAKTLSDTHPPLEALRRWMNLFVDYMATKRGLYAVLDSLAGGTSALYADSTEQMTTALRTLVERAEASGEASVNLDALDLLRAVAGVGQGGAGDDWVANAKKVVEILIAGIRARATAHPPGKAAARRSRKRGSNPKPGDDVTPAKPGCAPSRSRP